MTRLRTFGSWRLVALAVAAALVLALSAGAALVARADNPTTFYACLKSNGDLGNVVQSPASPPSCKQNETPISWNQAGPAGPAGPTGPQGPAGGGSGPATPHTAVIGTVTFDGPSAGSAAAISGELDLYGIETGIENPITTGSSSGGAGAGKVKLGEVTLVLSADAAGIPLYRAAAAGTHYATATVRLFQPGTTAVAMTYEYSLVVVTTVTDSSGGAAGEAPRRTVTLAVGAIQWGP
jgi:type VI protein secretion system component Hcp